MCIFIVQFAKLNEHAGTGDTSLNLSIFVGGCKPLFNLHILGRYWCWY